MRKPEIHGQKCIKLYVFHVHQAIGPVATYILPFEWLLLDLEANPSLTRTVGFADIYSAKTENSTMEYYCNCLL